VSSNFSNFNVIFHGRFDSDAWRLLASQTGEIDVALDLARVSACRSSVSTIGFRFWRFSRELNEAFREIAFAYRPARGASQHRNKLVCTLARIPHQE